MSFQKYAEYKESGVEWLGEVPKHWEVKRLKFCVQLTDKKIKADPEKPLPYIGLENIQSWTGKLLPLDPNVVPTSVANRFGKRMTLFGKLRPYLAKACNPDFEGLCSTELLVFKSIGFEQRLLLYLLLTDEFIKTVDSSTYGAKMPRANWDFIGNCIVPVPSREEQKRIAAFLDKETTKIDTLIEKQEQLITLLQEKRQAIISHAVTRGLNPNVKMKGSGIEWLGEVPEHWEVRRLKYICCFAYGDSLPSEKRIEGDVQVYGSNGHVGFHQFSNTIAPCIVIGRKGSFGKVNYSSDSVFAIDTTFFVDSRYTNANVRWLYYLLGLLQLDAVSKDSIVPGLNREDAYQQMGVYPPLKEQKQIATFLDKETTKINTLIGKCETAIELLKECRTALISAVVTGKIDVRDVD